MNFIFPIKKYKQNLLSILRTIGILAFITIPKPSFLRTPVLLLVILYYVYFLVRNLYYKIDYNKGKGNDLRFETSNDGYHKLTDLIIGTLLILVSIIAIIYDLMTIAAFSAIIIGLLMILNGYYFLPLGNFGFQANTLSIKGNNNEYGNFPIELINHLFVRNNSIVVTTSDGKQHSFFNLNISQQQLSSISNYINFHIPQLSATFQYTDASV